MSLRLEIKLKQPNALFEEWLEKWLRNAEYRNVKSRFTLRVALQALRSYPLPLNTGRECAILRGFGTKLCNMIDHQLCKLQSKDLPTTPQLNMHTFQTEVQQVVATVQKAKRRKSPQKPAKNSKKARKVLAAEEERKRQVTMQPGCFRIILLVDTQETNVKNKRTLHQTHGYLESLQVEYEVRRLTIGDFLWIARDNDGNELVLPYIVERKRFDDLACSIRDGRFHEQKHRLRQCGIQNVLYLVEDYGDNEHLGVPMESLQQAIINTLIHNGFLIAHTENHFRSMQYLQSMTKTMIRSFKDKALSSTEKEGLRPFQSHTDNMVGLLKFRALYEDSARNAQLTVRELFVQQLLQLHLLSLERALALVEVYPTPRLLLDAYEACSSEKEAQLLLAKITCGPLQRPIGKAISQSLYDFYKTEFK